MKHSAFMGSRRLWYSKKSEKLKQALIEEIHRVFKINAERRNINF